VDDLVSGWWLGLVVPKRHARRAVTRSLIKRQMREALRRHHQHLPPGQWVLRLRAPIDTRQFPSAASDALRAVVRAELEKLLGRITP
jgi:RNase P protein component